MLLVCAGCQEGIKYTGEDGRMERILFMEDESTIREVLTEYMSVAGYEVLEARDGYEAMDLLKKEQVDLAVLDIMVPGPDGLKVLAHIKESERTCRMGVIMLTALEDIQTQVSAFNALADDYIVKPASPIILLKRMEAVLRRVRAPKGKGEEGLQIDREGYRVTWNGNQIPLTISEFLLLQMLWEHPSRVYTREQLILGIFHEEYAGNDRIIDAHVKNIRRKIPIPCIRTVVGVGYCFEQGGEEEERV